MLDLNDIFPENDEHFMQDVLKAIGCVKDPSIETIHLVTDCFLTYLFSAAVSQ